MNGMLAPVLHLASTALEGAYALLAAPAPTLPSALCRIGLGGILFADGVERLRKFDISYGERALVTPSELTRAAKVPAVLQPLLRLTPRASSALHTALALAFTLGVFTKPAAALLCCSLLLVQLRNPFILYAGDSLARLVLLSLLFAPCDRSLSYDAWFRYGDLGLDAVAAPWGTRLIQLEVISLYVSNFIFKVRCSDWRDGSAVRKVLRNTDFAYAGLPSWLMQPLISRCMTYGTLAFEGLVSFGLCVAETRSASFWVALAFHGCIGLVIDVHWFGSITAAALMTFAPVEALFSVPTRIALGAAPTGPNFIAVGGVALYLSYMAWGYWPHKQENKERRGAAHRVLLPLRRWALFAPPGNTQLEWEIVAVSERGEVHPYQWSAAHGLYSGVRVRHRGTEHRARCFDLALSRNAELRAAFVRGVRRALRREHVDLRAFAVNALIWEVPHSPSMPAALKGGVRVALEIAPMGADIDLPAAVALARAMRCDAAFVRLFELLLRMASERERSARALNALHELLTDTDMLSRQRALSSESRRGLSALVDKLAPNDKHDLHAQMARVFAP